MPIFKIDVIPLGGKEIGFDNHHPNYFFQPPKLSK